MGEFSRTIGEKGEKVVDEILNLLGWVSTPINDSMPCNIPDKHKARSAKKGKSTHGSDSFYIYKSPFFTGQLDHILISSKYTDSTYPSGSSDFKSHFTDLSHTIECYANSALRNENSEGHYDIDGEKISGLLFWLSNEPETFNQSIFNNINAEIDKSLVYEANYIIDSCRASYLYNCIRSARYFYNEYKFEYYYIDTGNNPSDNNKRYRGKSLPIQLIVSDIQIFRLSREKEIIIALFMKDRFSVDSLSRVLGLAQGIAKALATKINIHYPDYESEKHESSVSRTKRKFEGDSLVDDINILSYHDTFTSLGNRSTSRNLPDQDDREVGPLKHNQILPYGNELRDLLSRSQITISEMNRLLRRKGVYVAEPKKENLIPILSSILLSPNEFDYLKEKQNTREDKVKRSSSRPLKCSAKVKEEGLINVVEKVNLKRLIDKTFYNFEFHNTILSFEPINNNPNKITATYTITKTVNNKIWFDNKNEFSGTIILKLGENGVEITPQSNHTCPETELINNSIKKQIINDLKESGIISHETEEEKILMNSMSNEEVIRFLLAFTNSELYSGITFEEVVSLDIEIDKTVALPPSNKIKWMEDKVKRLKLDGTKIEDLDLIQESENRQYLKSWGMVFNYKLDSQLGKAPFRINFFFQKSEPHEFSFNIEKISLNKTNSSKSKIENFILDEIDNIKLNIYNNLLK